MSEFIAEAQVLITPNVAAFRAELEAKLLAAPKGVVVPVSVVAAGNAAQISGALSSVATENTAVADSARVAAVATAEENTALQVLGATSVKTAAQQKALAASSAATARKVGQLERGAAATGLTFLGLRGATLAASGGFIAGAAGAIVLSKGIKEASDQVEQLNKSREVFGQFSKGVEDFAKTSAAAFGESNAKALELVSTFGALLRPIGFTQEAAARESLALTKLGADLASFFNTDVADALNAIQSGLVGQVRPLRRYGVELSAARVNALALADSGKKVSSALTDQEKVAARIKIIFRDSAIAQGDFARTSGQFANQTRILTAEISDLEGALGRLVVPGLTIVLRTMTTSIGVAHSLSSAIDGLTQNFKDLATAAARVPKGENLLPKVPRQESDAGSAFTRLSTAIGDAEKVLTGFPGLFIQSVRPVQTESEKTTAAVTKIFEAAAKTDNVAKFDGAMNTLIETLRKGTPEQQKSADQLQRLKDAVDALGTLPGAADFAALMKQLGIAVDTTNASTGRLTSGLQGLRAVLDEASGATTNLADAMKKLDQQSSTLNDKLQKLQAEGAAPQAQISQLQQLNANARARIAQAEAGGRQTGDISTIRKARAEIIANNSTIASLQAGIVSDQKAAAADAKSKAKDAQTARDEQFQALADTFGGRQQNIEDAISRAGITGNLAKEIRLNKALIVALKRELSALRDRLKTLQVSAKERKSILQAINRAIESAQQEQLRLTTERKANRAQRQQDEADRRQAHLEALLEIAQTTASTADDRAREKALIAFDQQQIRRILAIKRRRKLTADEATQLDAYRVDLAQRNAEIKKVTEESDKTKGLFFKFLQTQQGFAANLLGNLIPGFATAGLVGNSSAAAAGTEGLRQVAGGFEQPRVSVQGAAAVAGSRERGVRPVQVDTTNHILRQILAAVQGRRVPPEITHNRQRANAAYDTLGAMGD